MRKYIYEMKRKYIRTEIELKVKYQVSKNQNWYTTVTKGLGTNGLCLISREYLGIGTLVTMQLFLANSNRMIISSGEVLWSDFLIGRGLYEAGIKFLKLDDIDKPYINEQIDTVNFIGTNESKLSG
ncbi:MAG: PilZ domain-containing protein [Spirochaetales bacterium]|nr:PilZ domain-containing protein [Spirochaetales bacterium]